MAKTLSDLESSRVRRAELQAMFGGALPESIIRYDRQDKALDILAERRSYASKANDGGHEGILGDIFDVSGQSCRGIDGALSRFPQNVGRKLLLFYTDALDFVVDPFAGHNSRMELCFRCRRHYWGNDISAEFQAANAVIRNRLLEERDYDLFAQESQRPEIVLTIGTSTKLDWVDGFGDFTITSPPYWDLEHYGNEPEQLGIGKTYEQFLDGLAEVARENFRVLKPGAYCVWCVNDFRKGGRFYSYHCDVIDLMREAGFVQHDMAITDLGPSMRATFASQVMETRIIPKRHEYCLIFRKQ